MAVGDFNLMDPETLECPYPFYEALREEAPVHIIPEMGLAVVSTYDLLQEVVHDPATYSSAMPTGPADLPGAIEEAADEELESCGESSTAQARRRCWRPTRPTMRATAPW